MSVIINKQMCYTILYTITHILSECQKNPIGLHVVWSIHTCDFQFLWRCYDLYPIKEVLKELKCIVSDLKCPFTLENCLFCDSFNPWKVSDVMST